MDGCNPQTRLGVNDCYKDVETAGVSTYIDSRYLAVAAGVVSRRSNLLRVMLGLVFFLFLGHPSQANEQAAAEPIADNSFLMEEAYNQEPRVVQHINTFFYNWKTDAWEYSFTQEWPLLSQKHQLSFVVPILHVDEPATCDGLGDILLNYRYQLISQRGVAVSPRVTVSLPTGDEEKGLGMGSVGYQVNLPVSVEVGSSVVTHWNVGVTVNPDEKDASGVSASTTGINYGVSVIYLVSPTFNLLVEGVGESVEAAGPGEDREDIVFINPGFRFALNFASGLQIVPGLAFPFRVGSSDKEYGVFGYLSFEHPF